MSRSIAAILLLCAAGCGQTGGGIVGAQDSDDEESALDGPPGASCARTRDCPETQSCVGERCRPRRSSAAGEILAVAAASQLEVGDLPGAARTFEQAAAAYRAARAPVPPEVLCGGANAALQAAEDERAREAGARRADACFRGSLPGDPTREALLHTLARLRFDGLELALFDRAEAADRFFTQEPSRPTVDAIQIALSFPGADEPARPGFREIRERLESDAANRAMADCFIQDWDIRHEREASASLVVRLTTSMRDMGDYDIFVPAIEVGQSSMAQEGFEPCLAGALSALLAEDLPRLGHPVAWQAPVEVRARLE